MEPGGDVHGFDDLVNFHSLLRTLPSCGTFSFTVCICCLVIFFSFGIYTRILSLVTLTQIKSDVFNILYYYYRETMLFLFSGRDSILLSHKAKSFLEK